MSGDLEREDTILGTALSRAVDSQHVRETPFERSRLALRLARPARSFPFGALAAVAAFVLLLGAGAYLLGRGTPAEPTPSEPPVAATTTPAPTATTFPDREFRVFFARDQLPPLAKTVRVEVDPALQGVSARVTALVMAHRIEGGASAEGWNKIDLVAGRSQGDLATIALDGVGVRGSASEIAFLKEIVYTVTEEPGIRQVLLTDRAGGPLRLDQIVVDKAYTREEVFGYDFIGSDVPTIENDGGDVKHELAGWKVTNEVTPGLGRLSVELRALGATTGGRLDPRFKAALTRCDGCEAGPWQLRLDLPDAAALNPAPPYQRFVTGPISAIDVPHTRGPANVGTIFLIGLDDARPWRVTIEPTGNGTARLNVDIGGQPQQVNKNVAVYAPVPGADTARTFTVSGAARVFEANVAWRVRDGAGREVATGNTLATLGTSPVWGTFETQVTVPASVSGNVTLEMFWASPKDGGEMDVVSIPLTVR